MTERTIVLAGIGVLLSPAAVLLIFAVGAVWSYPEDRRRRRTPAAEPADQVEPAQALSITNGSDQPAHVIPHELAQLDRELTVIRRKCSAAPLLLFLMMPAVAEAISLPKWGAGLIMFCILSLWFIWFYNRESSVQRTLAGLRELQAAGHTTVSRTVIRDHVEALEQEHRSKSWFGRLVDGGPQRRVAAVLSLEREWPGEPDGGGLSVDDIP
jgi:hypothetical protein